MDQSAEMPQAGSLPGARRTRINEYVQAHGEASVTELSDAFGVSHDTVRRDLERLDQLGFLSRIHGGAVARRTLKTALPSASERGISHLEEKRRIAAATAALIHDGETVLTNGGTTILEVARALSSCTGLTLISCSPAVVREAPATALRASYLLAGRWVAELESVVGPVVLPGTTGLNADVVVLGASAISAASGVSTPRLDEAEMLRSMLGSASRRIVVADHSKFGVDAIAKFAPLSEVDTLVTDSLPSKEILLAIERAEVDLVVAHEAGAVVD